jgi:hypothetical protein
VRSVRKACLIAFISSLAIAQTNVSNAASDPSSLADEVKQLRQMMAEQQKAMAEQGKTVAEQQKQLSDQRQELERLRQRVNTQPQTLSSNNAVSSSTESSSADSMTVEPRLVNASLTAPASATAAAGRPVSTAPPQETERKESPLSFKIGGAEFTPGGFMDFTTIFRSTNTGNLGTNFFTIPFSNTSQGHLTELRFTAQNSRISLKATSKYQGNDIAAYLETDFLGNDATTTFITSNSHTLRQRLYFLQLKRGQFELQAGQMWGWLTPNRVGVSPFTPDVFYSLNMDFNYQVGLTWTRQPAIRFVYHPNDNLAIGLGLENPQQFAGQATGSSTPVTFPANFNATLVTQIDQGAGGTGNGSAIPNLHPDFVPKIAYDTTMGGKHFHVEAVGILRGFKIAVIPQGIPGGATFGSHTVEGGGFSGAVNLELIKGFHFVANGFWSDGGGRYIFGMAPDLVVLPANAAGTTCTSTLIVPAPAPGLPVRTATGCDARISLVHSYSGLGGFEWTATPQTTLYAYYGGMYAQRNFATDLTNTTSTILPRIGFGFPSAPGVGGSANNNNRAIQEPSLGWIQTFWKNPQFGALQLITQVSYVTRAPWFVAAGAPKNAHLTMGWVDLRYVLP